MIGGHELALPVIEPLAAELRDSTICLQKRLCGDSAKTNDHFRRDHFELPEQKWRTGGDFVFFGRAILRRTAFHDVANVDIFALQTHSFDHLSEKSSGAAYKGQTLRVFVGARTFSHKNQLGFGISVAEDNGLPVPMKLAASTFSQILANPQECVVDDLVGGIEERWSGRSW